MRVLATPKLGKQAAKQIATNITAWLNNAVVEQGNIWTPVPDGAGVFYVLKLSPIYGLIEVNLYGTN